MQPNSAVEDAMRKLEPAIKKSQFIDGNEPTGQLKTFLTYFMFFKKYAGQRVHFYIFFKVCKF